MKERKKRKRKHFCTQRHHHSRGGGCGDPSHTVTGMTQALEVVTAPITGVIRGIITSSYKILQHNSLTPAVMAITSLITGVMEIVIASGH